MRRETPYAPNKYLVAFNPKSEKCPARKAGHFFCLRGYA